MDGLWAHFAPCAHAICHLPLHMPPAYARSLCTLPMRMPPRLCSWAQGVLPCFSPVCTRGGVGLGLHMHVCGPLEWQFVLLEARAHVCTHTLPGCVRRASTCSASLLQQRRSCSTRGSAGQLSWRWAACVLWCAFLLLVVLTAQLHMQTRARMCVCACVCACVCVCMRVRAGVHASVQVDLAC